MIGYLRETISLLELMGSHPSLQRVDAAIRLIVEVARASRPILICGNGGSAADSMHISGELVGRFLKERRPLNCRSLAADPVFMSAWSNDYSFETVFSRQIEAYGERGGILIGLSTSGCSPNILRAFQTARSCGMQTIAFTGEGGGKLAAHSDILLDVPSKSTPLIQQVHICIYHYICREVETRLFPETPALGAQSQNI